jgi:hypothetical protein
MIARQSAQQQDSTVPVRTISSVINLYIIIHSLPSFFLLLRFYVFALSSFLVAIINSQFNPIHDRSLVSFMLFQINYFIIYNSMANDDSEFVQEKC